MTCVICKTGKPAPGLATVTLQRGATTVVLKDVPADICPDCGEYYLSSDMTREVLSRAENAAQRGAEVAVLRFAA